MWCRELSFWEAVWNKNHMKQILCINYDKKYYLDTFVSMINDQNSRMEKKNIHLFFWQKRYQLIFFTNLTGQHFINFKKLFLAENEIFLRCSSIQMCLYCVFLNFKILDKP